jgi:ribonuclease-3
LNAERARLCDKLGYRFVADDLLDDALTHRSAGRDNNERLEFLGDAVLGLVIAAELYLRNPEPREGVLTRWRATLVKKQTLAEIAREISLGDYLVLGSGELKSGGRRRDSILADTLEALIGAIYLDSGLQAARTVIHTLYGARLAELPELADLKDPKTRLQEYLQGRGLALPNYTVVDTQGKAHEQLITVQCEVEGVSEALCATDSSRRRAEQAAASLALAKLQVVQG